MKEPGDGTDVTVRSGLARDAPADRWRRCDDHPKTVGERRWHNLTRRRTPKTWRALSRLGPTRLLDPPPAPDRGGYPTCTTCGHNTSAVLAGRCTAFVATPGGPQHAEYCNCRCIDDPAVKDWLQARVSQR